METESVLQIGGQFQSVLLGFQGVLRNRRTSPPIQKVKIVRYGCNNEVCVLDLIISMFQQPHNESPSSQDLLLDQDGTACAGAAEQEPQCQGGQYFQGVNIREVFKF